MSLGFSMAGIDTLWAVERDTNAALSYSAAHPHTRVHTKVNYHKERIK
jgi:site-specific DNA-cytosine methylase